MHGEQYNQIAAKESVNRMTIIRDVKAIRKEWRKAREDYCQDSIDVELSRINRLQLEYWNAWLRSCEAAEKVNTKMIREAIRFLGDGTTQVQDERTEAGTTKEWQSGDPRFLEGYRWCIDRKLKLFGCDAPAKTAVDVNVTIKLAEYPDFYGNANRFTPAAIGSSTPDLVIAGEIQDSDVRETVGENVPGSNGRHRRPRAGPDDVPGSGERGDDLVGGANIQDD